MKIAALVVCLSFGVVAQEADPAVGRALYTGEKAFEKGGPPCGACHAMGGEGLAASFGPDLATSKVALDLDMLDGVMADQPYRTMKPLYRDRPISEAERGHVAAWIRSVTGKQPAGGGLRLGLGAGLIALALGAALTLRRTSR
jgi:mono/diheme cytochrome c family protein